MASAPGSAERFQPKKVEIKLVHSPFKGKPNDTSDPASWEVSRVVVSGRVLDRLGNTAPGKREVKFKKKQEIRSMPDWLISIIREHSPFGSDLPGMESLASAWIFPKWPGIAT